MRSRSALFIVFGLIAGGSAVSFPGAAQSGGTPPLSASRDAARWLVGPPVGLRLDVTGNGLVVGAVKSGDAAAQSGLRQGDRVQRVDDQPVTSAEAAAEEIQTAWNAGKSAVDLVVSRGGQDFYVALRLRQ